MHKHGMLEHTNKDVITTVIPNKKHHWHWHFGKLEIQIGTSKLHVVK